MSSISQYFDTASRSSSSCTSLGFPSSSAGKAPLANTSTSKAVHRADLAVAALDPQREEQAAVDDRVEAAVEPGDVVMSACTKTGSRRVRRQVEAR
jgi:hypothetical protein